MIYTAAEIKQIDRTVIQNGMPEEVLMERAATAIVPHIRIESQSTILVICGTGNNGGDGWVIARELAMRGHEVSVWSPLGKSKSEAAAIHASYASAFVHLVERPIETDVIIDALFGVGLSGPVTGHAREVIEWVNRQSTPVISIDVPSGIPSDHARDFDDIAIRATYTYSLHGFKRSTFLNRTAPFYGKVERIDIGLRHTSDWKVLTETDFDRSLLERDQFSHKTTYGHGMLIGGVVIFSVRHSWVVVLQLVLVSAYYVSPFHVKRSRSSQHCLKRCISNTPMWWNNRTMHLPSVPVWSKGKR